MQCTTVASLCVCEVLSVGVCARTRVRGAEAHASRVSMGGAQDHGALPKTSSVMCGSTQQPRGARKHAPRRPLPPPPTCAREGLTSCFSRHALRCCLCAFSNVCSLWKSPPCFTCFTQLCTYLRSLRPVFLAKILKSQRHSTFT
jgi:hypothetical protein